MSADELKPFHELHHTSQLICLDCFGGVRCNLEEFDNPLIECIFTPYIDPLPNAVDPKPYPKKSAQFMAGIAVGYLPMLFLGQFFQHGKQLPPGKWPRSSELITFELDLSQQAAALECTHGDIAFTSDLVSPHVKDSVKRSCVKMLNGVLKSSSNPKIKKVDKPERVLIYELELIRFYLTNSSHSSKRIFNGAFSDDNINKQVVNEIHVNKYLDPVTGAGSFVYRHGYRGADASMLGRILLDPTGTALQAAQRVHSKIVTDRLNSSDTRPGYPQTYFPFNGKTTLKLSGRWIETEADWVFLAYKIHSCSAPFPYKSLTFCDEFQPGGKPAPADAPEAHGGGFPIPRKPDEPDEDKMEEDNPDPLIGESKSDERPSATSIQLRIELGHRTYEGLAEVDIQRRKLTDSRFRYGKRPIQEDEGLNNASTGGATYGGSTARRQSVEDTIVVPAAVSEDLVAFIGAIQELKSQNKNWEIQTIVIDAGSDSHGEKTSYFPAVPCAKLTTLIRQFSFMDDKREKRRRFICVEILASGRFYYIFESQRRLHEPPPTDGTTPFKDFLPILLLHAPGYEKVLPDDFVNVIKNTVIRTTWPKATDLGIFVRHDIAHGDYKQATVDDLRAKMEQLIRLSMPHS